MRVVGRCFLVGLVLTALFVSMLAVNPQPAKTELKTSVGLNAQTGGLQGFKNAVSTGPSLGQSSIGAEQPIGWQDPGNAGLTGVERLSSQSFSNLEPDANGCARLIVGVNASRDSVQGLEGTLWGEGANVTDQVSFDNAVQALAIEVPTQRLSFFAQQLQTSGAVRYVEPDSRVNVSYTPNDPYWSSQWGPQKIEADKAWETTNGSSSVLVAIVDTGIDYNHPDLAANYVPLGYNWVSNTTDPLDDYGHGTHCAGIVAAQANNGIGIAGLAQVHIMAEKVISSGGWGYDSWVAQGIIHATNAGANIISMSLGGDWSDLMYDAVNYARSHGVLVIAAAGNSATDQKSYPAGYDGVMAVSATDSNDNLASFSNFGDWIDVAAPGVNIYSTMPTYHVAMNDMGFSMNYSYMSGTSMACPHAAGVAALAWSLFRNCSANQIRMIVENSADNLGFAGLSELFGHGRVNPRRAVGFPDHDLRIVGCEYPRRVDLGQSCEFNVTVGNYGRENEANISVQFFVNNTLDDSATIGFLEAFSFATVVFSWNTTVTGGYDAMFYVVPVPGESSTQDNVASYYTMVRFAATLRVRSDYQTIKEALNYSGAGDTILVDEGYYSEGEIDVLADNITLIANGNVLVDGWNGHCAINVMADFVTIEGFDIRNCPYYGVRIHGYDDVLTRNSIINNGQNGKSLRVYDSSCCTISQNYIEAFCDYVFIERCSNSTITGNKLIADSWRGGMHIVSCSNSTISFNYITGGISGGVEGFMWSGNALEILDSQYNLIDSNTITNNQFGLSLAASPNNVLRNNTMVNNFCNFCPWGSSDTWGRWSGPSDVDASNTADGKPICYWVNVSNEVVPSGVACVVLVNCANIKVENQDLKNNYNGVCLMNSSSILIQDNNFTLNGAAFDFYCCGIFGSTDSFNLTITHNNVTHNDNGIILWGYNNTVSMNVIANSYFRGVWVSSNSTVTQNNITYNNFGVEIDGSNCAVTSNDIMANFEIGIKAQGSNHTIASNNIIGNAAPDDWIWRPVGIVMDGASGCTITLNNFIHCWGGGRGLKGWNNGPSGDSVILTNQALSNTIFHNNFINNIKPLENWDQSVNKWDNGYPAGGNYWSSYNGTDSNGDGIGDEPYVLDVNNTDNYPLMTPITENPPPQTFILTTRWIGNATAEAELYGYELPLPSPGTYIFMANSTIHVDTDRTYDAIMDHWELDSVNIGSGESADVQMDANHTLVLFMSEGMPLNVSISPTNVITLPGQSVTLNSSLAGGRPPYDYQWSVNGSIVWDATSPTWNFTPAEHGVYNITLTVRYPFSNGSWSIPTTSNTTRVCVTILGDVDGDFRVDIGDIVSLCDGFGSTRGADGNYWHKPPGILDPFSPNLDIDGNGIINMGDIVTALDNFGQHYP